MAQEWTISPGSWEDLPAVVAVVEAENLEVRGRSGVDLEETRERLEADPDGDPARDHALAWVDGTLAGVALITPNALNIAVHPEHEHPEVRGALVAWGEAQLRERGRPLVAAIPAGSTATAAVLTASGFALERFYAEMVRDFRVTGAPQPGAVPPGYKLRPADRVADREILHRLDDRAFSGRPDYRPEPLESFDVHHLSVSSFAPEWTLVAETNAGAAAAALIGEWRPARPGGYVSILAVDPDHQHRGLGRALLLRAFGIIHDLGLPSVELHVASDNPRALDLYTGVGMVEAERIGHYVKPA